MKRKCLAIGIILLFLGTCIIPAIAQDIQITLSSSRGNWLYVGGSGPENYTRIQDAIKNSTSGDTVFVFHGVYNESFSIDKSITVLGEDKNTTIIDGKFENNAIVQLVAENIYFSGFKVIHSKFNLNGFGISVSSHNIVTNNIVADNQGGYGNIFLIGEYNQINHNVIQNNTGEGIFIKNTASYNHISENNINANSRGIWLGSTDNNIITKNYIHNNSREGIYIAGTQNNEFSYNILEKNGGAAFYFREDVSDDIIKGNIIKNNGEGLVILDAQSLIITQNSFYSQGIQLSSSESNYWISHTITGNFINEKPIYCFKNEKDVVVPSDAGQVILVFCSSCHIENLNISNVDYGILLGFSWKNTISDNQFINITGDAIQLKDSTGNEIFNNRIFNGNNGIFIGARSNSVNIHDNIIKNNIGHGIYLQSSFNIIHRNSLENNYAGVYIDFSYFNTISQNNFINNSKYQIGYLVNYLLPKSNNFKNNYYSDVVFFIKIISGKVRMYFTTQDKLGDIMYFYRPSFTVDWHPAQEPYDIPGMS
jgi:parallel beta-helix repeat protein